MRRTCTRGICGLLALLMVFSMLPVQALAAENTEAPVAQEQTEVAQVPETEAAQVPETEEAQVTEPETTQAPEPEEAQDTELEAESEEVQAPETEEIQVAESEAEPEITVTTATAVAEAGDLSSEELFAGYAQQLFYGGAATYGTAAGDELTGDTRRAYDALVPVLRQIANGQRASTTIAVGKTLSSSYVADVDVDFETTSLFPEGGTELGALLRALLADLPYELYWFDKTAKGALTATTATSGSDILVTFKFTVGGRYKGAEAYTVDTSVTGVAATAAGNAQAVVEAAAGMSDYKKLVYFRDWICDNVSYDHDAAGSGNFSDTPDPWQLIYVFDGDSSTNVVCEGYSKAFQYLCDEAGLTCRLVWGDMTAPDVAGGHMWNIVTLDGQNYLVDVTNSETGTSGADGSLFLAGGAPNEDGSYTFAGVTFTYDENMASLYGDAALTLATESYDPSVGYEDQFIAAMANGERFFLEQDLTLTRDVTIPLSSLVDVSDGHTLTVSKDVTLTVNGQLLVSANSHLVVNGTLVNNMTFTVDFTATGATFTVGTTGVLENNNYVRIGNGSTTFEGTYIAGANAFFDLDTAAQFEGINKVGKGNVVLSTVVDGGENGDDAELVAAVAMDYAFYNGRSIFINGDITLAEDLTIPGGMVLHVGYSRKNSGGVQYALTIGEGATLTIEGTVFSQSFSGIYVASGGTMKVDASYASVSLSCPLVVQPGGVVQLLQGNMTAEETITTQVSEDGASFGLIQLGEGDLTVNGTLDNQGMTTIGTGPSGDYGMLLVYGTVNNSGSLYIAYDAAGADLFVNEAGSLNNTGVLYLGGGSTTVNGTFTHSSEHPVIKDSSATVVGIDAQYISCEAYVTTEDALRQQLNTDGYARKVVVPTADLTLSSDVTIPAGVELAVERDCILTIPAGVTVYVENGGTLLNNNQITGGGQIMVYSGGAYEQTSSGSVSGVTIIDEDQANDRSQEEAIISAIEMGSSGITLERDVTIRTLEHIPEGFTIAVPDYITMTVEKDLAISGGLYVLGTLVNNARLTVDSTAANAEFTVAQGATVQNNGDIQVNGGTLDFQGTYSRGTSGSFLLSSAVSATGVENIGKANINYDAIVTTEDELRAAMALTGYKSVSARMDGNITLTKDLTIPAGTDLVVGGVSSTGCTLTVNGGVTLTNNSLLSVYPLNSLIVEAGGTLVNNDYISVWEYATLTVRVGGSYVENGTYYGTDIVFETQEADFIIAMNAGEPFTLVQDLTITQPIYASDGASISAVNGASLYIGSGGTLSAQGTLTVDCPVELLENGAMVAEGGTLVLNGQVTNGGALHAGFPGITGTIELNGTVYNNAYLAIHDGSVLNVNAGGTLINGPKDEANFPLVQSGGTINVSGRMTNYYIVIFNSADVALNVNAGGTLTNEGLIDAMRGGAVNNNGGSFSNVNGGIYSTTLQEAIDGAIMLGDTEYTVPRDFTISDGVIVPEGFTLIVPESVTLTIRSRMTLYGNLFVHGTYVLEGDLWVTSDAENAYILVAETGTFKYYNNCAFDMRNGTLEFLGTFTPGIFYQNGTIVEYNVLTLFSDVEVIGIDNIGKQYIFMGWLARSEADLREGINYREGFATMAISTETDITLTSDLTLPEEAVLSIYHTLTVPAGVSFTNDYLVYVQDNATIDVYGTMANNGELDMTGTVHVHTGGKLENTNRIYWGLEYDNPKLQVDAGGQYTGTGMIQCDVSDLETIAAAMPGLDLADFTVTEFTSGSYTYWAVKLIQKIPVTDQAELVEAINSGATHCVLAADVAITSPLHIPQGVHLTVPAGYILDVDADLTVSGELVVEGTLFNNAQLIMDSTAQNAEFTVAQGATVQNNGAIQVNGGTLVFQGTYGAGEAASFLLNAQASATGVENIGMANIDYDVIVSTESELRAALAETGYKSVYARIDDTIDVTWALTIPENMGVIIGGVASTGSSLTVCGGASLDNRGTLTVGLYNTLEVLSGGTLTNYGHLNGITDSLMVFRDGSKFANHGSCDWQGEVIFENTMDGFIATMSVGKDYTLTEDLVVTSDVDLNDGASITAENGAKLIVPDGVVLHGLGDVTINCDVEIQAGGRMDAGYLPDTAHGAVTFNGHLTIAEGGLLWTNGGSVTLNGTADVWGHLFAGFTDELVSACGTITVNGTLNILGDENSNGYLAVNQGSTLHVTSTGVVNNDGYIDHRDATIIVDGTLNDNFLFTIAGGSVTVNGTFTRSKNADLVGLKDDGSGPATVTGIDKSHIRYEILVGNSDILCTHLTSMEGYAEKMLKLNGDVTLSQGVTIPADYNGVITNAEGGAYTLIVGPTGSLSGRGSLVVECPVEVQSGGSVMCEGAMTFNADVTIDGSMATVGQLVLNGSVTNNGVLHAGFPGENNASVPGTIDVNGTLTNNAYLAVHEGATLNIHVGASVVNAVKTDDNYPFIDNAGTINVYGELINNYLIATNGNGGIVYGSGAVVENNFFINAIQGQGVTGSPEGTFTQSPGSVYATALQGLIDGACLMGEDSVSIPCNITTNESTTIPEGFTLTVPAGTTLTVAVGGSLEVLGELVVEGTLVIRGQVSVGGTGTVDVSGGLTNFGSLDIAAQGTVRVSGSLNNAKPAATYSPVITSAGTMEISGTMVNNADIRMSQGATIDALSGCKLINSGTLDLGNDSTVTVENGGIMTNTGKIVNMGTNGVYVRLGGKYVEQGTVDGDVIYELPVPVATGVNAATGTQVYWEALDNVACYGVWRSGAENGEYTLVSTGTSTVYTDTNVTAGQTYYYRVTSMDAGGRHSAQSATVAITYVTAPKIVAATSGAYVQWSAIPGATTYGVWCSKNGADGDFELLGTTTATNFTNRSVPSGSTYYYAISIVSADGTHSTLSKAINHTFLATPSITSRSNVTEGVKLTWNKITGAQGYAVYRKTYTSSVWTRVATIEDGSTLTWTDESVRAKNGQGYHYTVRALAGSKLTILSAQRINGTPIVRLTAQTLKSAVKVSSTAIKCNWSTSSVVAGYEIRLMSGGSVYKTYIVSDKTTATKAITGLARGKTYTVQIRTYATLDAGTYYSAWSNAKSVTLS